MPQTSKRKAPKGASDKHKISKNDKTRSKQPRTKPKQSRPKPAKQRKPKSTKRKLQRKANIIHDIPGIGVGIVFSLRPELPIFPIRQVVQGGRFRIASGVLRSNGRRVKLKGLTSAIKETFMPGLSDFVLNGTRFSSEGETAASFGTKIDKQFQDWVRLIADKDTAGLQAFRRTLKPAMRRVMELFEERKWTPVAAQIPVMHQSSRLGTCVDLIVVAADGAYIVIEIKTGYERDGTFGGIGPPSSTIGRFAPPAENLALTAVNYAKMQLCATHAMFKQTYYTTNLSNDMFVVHVGTEHISIINVNNPELLPTFQRAVAYLFSRFS